VVGRRSELGLVPKVHQIPLFHLADMHPGPHPGLRGHSYYIKACLVIIMILYLLGVHDLCVVLRHMLCLKIF
jgi:hypothetical protein